MRTITLDPPIHAKSPRIETTALVPVPVPLWVADDQSTPEAPDAEPGPSGVPQRPNLRQRLRLGSWIRRLLAAALVGIAIWWMVLPLFFPVTNQAVVNARLVQIRAPIDGTPVEFPHDLGDRIAAREMLARIVNPLADTTTLSHLKTREAELAARHNAVLLELDQVTKSEATCRETCQAYMKNRTAFLQSVVQQTEAALQIALVQQDNTNKEWARLDRVRNGSQSAVSVGEYDKATEMKAVSQRRIEAERAALDKSKVELKAAREGVYVSLETPSFLARAEELALKVKTLKNAQLETEQHLVVHKAEVEREQRRIDSLSSGIATSPVTGVVWKRYGNLGQSTKQNETMYEIADAGSVFVEAQLNQRHMATIRPGSQATVRLTGGRLRQGTVRSATTLGPADAEPSFAVNLPGRDFKQVRVVIAFDAEPGDAELIGRHVRVLITDSSPDLLDRGVTWLFSIMGD